MPNRFPQEAALRDGRRLLIRPFTAHDARGLWDFFLRLPEDYRRFAWDNISDPIVVEGWARNVDYGKVLPLLALDGQKVVADATLHRRDHGPLRRAGRLKWLLDPEYRGQGLGTTLVNTLIGIGREQGMRHLTTLLISDLEADAVHTLTELGFDRVDLAGYGTDPDGDAHDMVKLTLAL
ncbi:MAG: GNAT family N-acetyltransferase [Acidobacteriota bacterium]|nr:GNAT family N-acetyltransferase [Acidobacteriota bacterium]MDH3522751.1 GNAT family N-acetyltransferase [Acidobacteriota bacterium]